MWKFICNFKKCMFKPMLNDAEDVLSYWLERVGEPLVLHLGGVLMGAPSQCSPSSGRVFHLPPAHNRGAAWSGRGVQNPSEFAVTRGIQKSEEMQIFLNK